MSMATTYKARNSESGFTLIELSIVLVIIGLIVGGVLVGQDMIKAAEVRATVAQIERYNTSVNTFRSKYNYMPGDMPVSVTSRFGFFTETTAGGTTGHGDGNSLIEGGAQDTELGEGETLTFWRHLGEANLADGSYGQIGDSALVVGTGLVTGDIDASEMGLVYPPAKLQRGNYISCYANGGINYFELKGMTAMQASDGSHTTAEYLAPLEALNMDTKVDDGRPLTGSVRATEGTGALGTLAVVDTAAAGVCVEGATSNYNTASENYANAPSCGLRFRFN